MAPFSVLGVGIGIGIEDFSTAHEVVTDDGTDQTELYEPSIDPDTDTDPDWNPFFGAAGSYERRR